MKEICNNYGASIVYNGSEVKSIYRECQAEETPYNDYEVIHKVNYVPLEYYFT